MGDGYHSRSTYFSAGSRGARRTLFACQKMLGHASAVMTLHIYADLFEDDLGALAPALHNARARGSAGEMWARGGAAPSMGLLIKSASSRNQALICAFRSPSPRLRC